MTRLVGIADTHTFQSDLAVPEGDVLVHAGDMLRAGTLQELEPVARWWNALPHPHKILVPGNHDVCFQKTPTEAHALFDAVVLEDRSALVEGLRFYGSPWQPQHDDWAYYAAPDAIAARWSAIPENVDVLITHTPPRGVGDRVGRDRRVGCPALWRAVSERRPRLHLCGHVHQEGGAWRLPHGWFANVTTWECERPATVIDVHADRVTLLDVPPADPLALQRAVDS